MKIFIILPRIPYPLEKGDKLRAFNQLKYLSARHEIHLCALNDSLIHPDAMKALQPFCKSVHFLSLPVTVRWFNLFKTIFNGKPFQVGYFFSRKNQKEIDRLISEIKPDHIYCQLVRVAGYVMHYKIRKTLDYQDAFSMGIRRRLVKAPFYFKPLLKIEYKRLARYEAEVFDRFDNKTIISYPDREFILHPHKEQIVVVPNGVDMEYYKPVEREKKFDLLFTGNMGYPPNVYSVRFLVNEILPLVHKKLPGVKLLIAGANPSAKVLALQSANITVTGWVEDMRECYAQSRIFIAPMLIGTGLQNKLLEAMAMQLPCITSELVNNALGAENGKEILVSRTAAEFTSNVIMLLQDDEKRKKLGLQGYRFVAEKYRWDAVNEILHQLICK